MAAKEKAVNFTAEQFAALKAVYLAAEGYQARKEAIAAFAPTIGKTERSCIAKLSREGIYKAKEYTNKAGEKPVDKETLTNRIASALGVSAEVAESLTKANKAILEKIAFALEAD
jgi:hypothetical protein